MTEAEVTRRQALNIQFRSGDSELAPKTIASVPLVIDMMIPVFKCLSILYSRS